MSSSDESDSSNERRNTKVRKALEVAFDDIGKKRAKEAKSHPGYAKIPKRAETDPRLPGNSIQALLCDEVMESCVQFLKDRTLESAPGTMEAIRSYLQGLSAKEQRLGMFFLSGDMHHLFSHHLHLKEAVLQVMEEKYGMLLKSLLKSDITMHPHFAGLDTEIVEELESVGSSMDNLLKIPTFFLVDMVSVQVFASVYYLGQKAGTSDSGGSFKEDFWGVHETALAEVSPLPEVVNRWSARD